MDNAQNALVANPTAIAAQLVIPTLDSLPLAAAPSTFAAFKAEEMVSFVRQYDPRVQAIEGMRHAIIRYRNTDKKAVEKQAQMITVPKLVVGDDVVIFADTKTGKAAQETLQAAFEDEQDSMIRSMIDQGKSAIYWSTITLDEVIASLTALRVSNRLSKEQIENWARIAFVAACNQRADQVSESKGYNADQQAKQRAGTLNAYVELAAKLAAPVPNIGQEAATALKNMLAVAKLDDDMAKVIGNKLHAILNPVVLQGDYL